MYHLIESIELVARLHLNIQNVQVSTPGTNICKVIMEDVINSESILSHWEVIAQCSPAEHEQHSMELLQIITNLWITICGHSFTKDWTMKFEGKYKKGTREILKQKQ